VDLTAVPQHIHDQLGLVHVGQEKVRDAFPYEDWDKPFSEFTAAKAVQMSLPED
jgi:hypothetical protein